MNQCATGVYMLTKPDFIKKKIVLIFANDGDKLSFKNDNLIVTDKDSEVKLQQTCYSLFAIFLVGNTSITSGLIQRSKKFGFSIMLFSSSFKLYSSVNFALEGNTILRKKQYTTTKSVAIANRIIINKIRNQREILKRLRNKDIAEAVDNLNVAITRLSDNDYQINEIMGLEGTTAKVYFNRLFKELGWHGRQPRIKRDEINLFMDIGYTALFNYLEAVLNIYGFDIYKGNLHQEFYNRKSLVCDIIEPFRPIIDYKIRKMINLGQTKNYKYLIDHGRYNLTWKDSSDFLRNILKEIVNHQEQIFTYIQQYYRWFMKDQNTETFPEVSLNVNN